MSNVPSGTPPVKGRREANAKKPGKPALAALLDAWVEENKPSCPVGKLLATLGDEDTAAAQRLLDQCSAVDRRRKIPAKVAAQLFNTAFDTAFNGSTVLDHNGERCSCYGAA